MEQVEGVKDGLNSFLESSLTRKRHTLLFENILHLGPESMDPIQEMQSTFRYLNRVFFSLAALFGFPEFIHSNCAAKKFKRLNKNNSFETRKSPDIFLFNTLAVFGR